MRARACALSLSLCRPSLHRYGHTAGEATHDAVNSAINVGMTAYNLDNIGIKAMVKKTAKETGQTILEDYRVADPSKGGVPVGGAPANGKGGKDAPTEEGEGSEARRKGP